MNWSDLNHDVLRLIAKKVRDISDFIRLRTVCKRWRSVVDLSDMAPQSPCNINYYNCKSSTSFSIRFRQNFFQRSHVVPINNISVQGEITFVCASLSGVLLLHMSKNSKPWLLVNPLTGFHTLLPFQKGCPFAYPIYFGHSCRPKTNLNLNLVKNDIDVVFVVKDNSGAPGGRGYEIGLWRYDDMEWRRIARVPYSHEEHASYCNNGRLCFVSQETGHIRAVDINTGKVTVILDRKSSIELAYLVEGGGDLLCVFCNVHKYQFEVYLLEDFDTNLHLKKLKSIGNRVIFINSIYSALCLNASDCEGYRSNSIYLNTYSRYDIENNTTEPTGPLINTRWFIPSLF